MLKLVKMAAFAVACLDYCRKDYKGLWVLCKGLYGHDKLACHVKAVQADEAHRQAQAQE